MSEASAYHDVAAVYDALMAGVPHAHWLSRIERAVRERGKTPRSVLDIACGTGIVTELLWKRGYRPVVGVDLSESMLRIAQTKSRAKSYGIEYFPADAATLDLGERRFELLVSLFDSLNYILEPERLRQAFHRFFAQAAPGAILAFDMNTPYALSKNLFTQKETLGPVQHDWTAHWDPETRQCRVEMDFLVIDTVTGNQRQFHETHHQYAYELAEVQAWLTEAGWTRITPFGNYGDYPPRARSDRWLIVAEKPD